MAALSGPVVHVAFQTKNDQTVDDNQVWLSLSYKLLRDFSGYFRDHFDKNPRTDGQPVHVSIDDVTIPGMSPTVSPAASFLLLYTLILSGGGLDPTGNKIGALELQDIWELSLFFRVEKFQPWIRSHFHNHLRNIGAVWKGLSITKPADRTEDEEAEVAALKREHRRTILNVADIYFESHEGNTHKNLASREAVIELLLNACPPELLYYCADAIPEKVMTHLARELLRRRV